jgi:WD40 repeat protein
LTGHTNFIITLAILTNGNLASSAFLERSLRIWNPNNGSLVSTLLTGQSLSKLASLPNGNLASGEIDIKIWNPNNGSLLYTLKGHGAGIEFFATSKMVI